MSESPNILLLVHYYEPKSEKRGFYASEHTNSHNLGYMDKGTEAGSTPTTWTTRETGKKAPACLMLKDRWMTKRKQGSERSSRTREATRWS